MDPSFTALAEQFRGQLGAHVLLANFRKDLNPPLRTIHRDHLHDLAVLLQRLSREIPRRFLRNQHATGGVQPIIGVNHRTIVVVIDSSRSSCARELLDIEFTGNSSARDFRSCTFEMRVARLPSSLAASSFRVKRSVGEDSDFGLSTSASKLSCRTVSTSMVRRRKSSPVWFSCLLGSQTSDSAPLSREPLNQTYRQSPRLRELAMATIIR